MAATTDSPFKFPWCRHLSPAQCLLHFYHVQLFYIISLCNEARHFNWWLSTYRDTRLRVWTDTGKMAILYCVNSLDIDKLFLYMFQIEWSRNLTINYSNVLSNRDIVFEVSQSLHSLIPPILYPTWEWTWHHCPFYVRLGWNMRNFSDRRETGVPVKKTQLKH